MGSYSRVGEDANGRGLLMVKPLDEGCVLFDLSVQEADTDSAPGNYYRLTGVFILDDEQHGLWEDKNSGCSLQFTKYRKRITIKTGDALLAAFSGKYDLCSSVINGNARMLEQFVEYLPLFKTELSAKGNYQVRDISDAGGDICKIEFIAEGGSTKVFWAVPSLDQVLRVEGSQGVIIYQAESAQQQ
ncbi:hypothetical protein IJT17_09005 [bacterium]|nr:hypothetical protein [bacterium]